jgi:hypothetical protein
MTSLRLAVVATTLLALLPTVADTAEQPKNTSFKLTLCNMSQFRLVRAAIVYQKDEKNWTVEGWHPLPDYGCSIIGTFRGDSIFYFAFGFGSDGKPVFWSAGDDDKSATSQCVDGAKSFSAAIGSPTCPTGQTQVKFRKLTFAPDDTLPTITLHE